VCIYFEEGGWRKAQGRESFVDVFRSFVDVFRSFADCRALVQIHKQKPGEP